MLSSLTKQALNHVLTPGHKFHHVHVIQITEYHLQVQVIGVTPMITGQAGCTTLYAMVSAKASDK